MPEIDQQHVEKLAAAVANLAAIVEQLRGQVVEPPPHIKAAVERYLAAGICLRCEQKKSARFTRGLDANCYNATIKEIGRGEVTEADLILKGRITAQPQRGGRKSTRRPLADVGELPSLPLEAPANGTAIVPNSHELEALRQSQEAERRDKGRDKQRKKRPKMP